MLVDAAGLAVNVNREELSRDERHQHGDGVERDHDQHAGDNPRRRQIGDRADAHHFQRVYLLVDPHRAQLGGRAGTDRGRQCQAGRGWRDHADVQERRQKTSQRFDSDVGQGVIALYRDKGAGGQSEEADDAHGAPDHRQRTGTHTHLRDQPQHFSRVAPHRIDDGGQRFPVERGLFAEFAGGRNQPGSNSGEPYRLARHIAHLAVTFTPSAVTTMLMKNKPMNEKTTVSFTAFPTPVGPPPTERPL